MIEVRSIVKCPYCGHENRVWMEKVNIAPEEQLEYCDVETGGCDKRFVLRITMSVLAESFSINYPEEVTPVTKP